LQDQILPEAHYRKFQSRVLTRVCGMNEKRRREELHNTAAWVMVAHRMAFSIWLWERAKGLAPRG
ncbi:MAG TPA: hypothetical protein VHI98_17620, partial [Vicinamibacterales bacterium]|nr:hypothetical protein [Vicinamibacterales bacterium]